MTASRMHDMAKTASLTDVLFNKFEAQILSGEMAPGSRFPPQKEIAEREEVSRTVVREAVARLEARGFAISRQGAGVFVSETARYKAFQVTRDEMSELSDVIALLEMRLAIEAEMAALAAARRTNEDVKQMRQALRHIADVSDDPEAAAAADAAFHLAIGRATRNEYYVRIVEFLGIRLVPPRNLYLRDRSAEAHCDYVEKVRGEHQAILDAIVRMDTDGARDAARHHMRESLGRHSELSHAVGNAR